MKALVTTLCAGALVLTAACTPGAMTADQKTAIGALSGAAVGASVSRKGDQTKGALIGAAVGAVAGTALGQTSQRGQCYYANGRGGTYIAPC